jgi:hypothetical protein
VSSSLSPIFYLFLGPSSILYLKVQHLLAEDELLQGSNSPHQKSTTKSNHPKYGIPADQWPAIVHRVVEQKEPLRAVAIADGVSHETIRRMLLQIHQQYGQQDV